MPLRHPRRHHARRQARRHDDGLREATMDKTRFSPSRPHPLLGGRLLVWSLATPVGLDTVVEQEASASAQTGAPPSPRSSRRARLLGRQQRRRQRVGLLRQDRHGPGRRSPPSITQIVAEELDVAGRETSPRSWATPRPSCNQGGASGSTGIQRGGSADAHRAPRRRAACWSRWRPRSFGVPADQLGTVTDGGRPARHQEARVPTPS